MTPRVRVTWLISMLLVAVPAVVLAPVLSHDFVAWDDDLHVYENPRFQPITWEQVRAFWSSPYENLYIPLTYTVWAAVGWLTQTLWPGPLTASLFHRLNLLLHLGNMLMVYRIGLLVLPQQEPGTASHKALAAAAGALLFGLHPLQVEAVAWISGLKDVLCGWWTLLAVWQYVAYVQAPSSRRRVIHYGLAAGAFGLALLAKPAAVTVPVLAGLLAVVGLGQSWKAVLRALGGWLVVAVVWGAWTKGQQPDTAMAFVTPLWARPMVAADAIAFYLGKLLWPVGLVPDYGRTPQVVLQQGWAYGVGLGLLGLAGVIWWWRKWWGELWLALVVFIAGVLPVLGGLPFLFQAYSTVADRYVYLALLGPALGWGGWLWRVGQRQWVVWIGSALILGLLGWRSTVQSQVWQNTITLFTHTLRVNPGSALAHNNLGWALAQQRQFSKAIAHYERALQLKGDMLEAHYNLGDALAAQGQLDSAISHYTRVLQLKPTWAEAHINLGTALIQQGKTDEAIAHYTQALRLKPDWAVPYNNLGDAMARQGRLDEALTWFSRAIQLKPRLPEAAYNLGGILWQRGRHAEAIAAYRNALRHRPHWLQAANHLAWLLATQENPSPQDASEAVALAEAVCQGSGYRDAVPLRTLAAAYYAAGQQEAAVRVAQQALTQAEAAHNAALVAQVAEQLQYYKKRMRTAQELP
jgi:tetratricopeptide (TPR) repeat protein